MKKKMYEHPELEFTVLLTEDILTTSENTDGNQGTWDELALFSKK